MRLRRVPINEGEMRQISEALTKELAGLGPLEDLLADPAVEDILINGYDNVFVSRRGVLARETLRFTDNQHVLRIVPHPGAHGPAPGRVDAWSMPACRTAAA